MQVINAIAKILKKEGVEWLIGYPVNPIIEGAAQEDIRTIMVRQERIGLHMCDAVAKTTSGDKIGVFVMQHGPGTENAFGGVAQSFGDSTPVVVLPAGYARNINQVHPNFNAALNFRHVTKLSEQVTVAEATVEALRRAYTTVKNGRPGPVLVEFPTDILRSEIPDGLVDAYKPAPVLKSGPDPRDVSKIAEALVAAERPVICAGQGVHYGKAWPQLKALAELLESPVMTTLGGKSAFPESHALSLGSGGIGIGGHLWHFLQNADFIFGIGCSFTRTSFGTAMPAGKKIAHATLDAYAINKDIPVDLAAVGDAGLVLDAVLDEVRDRLKGKQRDRLASVSREIRGHREEWLGKWKHRLEADTAPISPYRVVWDLLHTVDVDNTIITHDAGSPRDQISPFWQSNKPLSYLGWGKTTQLGYGLGLAMGAKLANPDKLCVNFWGDAAIGFTGMDFETAVRERLPILSILSNNFSMAIELKVMPISTEKFRSTDISGNYADFAKALGGYGERVTEPGQIKEAIKRGIKATKEGKPALLEFITEKATDVSRYP
ncbi:MAG TPA: thiamine pyrophosphate-requiring protein [Stellaceae bacterium]|nr:thiamine pyrophosphate-requiring protein [Stellaceae bacterium]